MTPYKEKCGTRCVVTGRPPSTPLVAALPVVRRRRTLSSICLSVGPCLLIPVPAYFFFAPSPTEHPQPERDGVGSGNARDTNGKSKSPRRADYKLFFPETSRSAVTRKTKNTERRRRVSNALNRMYAHGRRASRRGRVSKGEFRRRRRGDGVSRVFPR